MARRAWAPDGVDRFYALVRERYYDDARFFRVVKGFRRAVRHCRRSGAEPPRGACARIADEPVKHTNARGTISYARGGRGTRTVQLYINLMDNARLDTLEQVRLSADRAKSWPA